MGFFYGDCRERNPFQGQQTDPFFRLFFHLIKINNLRVSVKKGSLKYE